MLNILLLVVLAIFLVVYALRKREKSNKAYYDQRNLKYYNPSSLWAVFLNKFTPIDFSRILYDGLPNEP